MTDISRNFFLDNADLQFQVERLDMESMLPVLEFDPSHPDAIKTVEEARAQYKELLTMLGQYVAEKIAPHVHELDKQEPHIENGEVIEAKRMRSFLDGLKDLGAMGLPLSRHVGGMNVPWTISVAFSEMLARADVSLMTYHGFYAGIGMALQLYSFEEDSIKVEGGALKATRFDKAIAELAAGDTCGAMVLTEPQAGSDLAQIRSKATLGDDGKWLINGQKIWITCGHGEHHLVLARSESSETHPGLKGLSLFYVAAHKTVDGKRVRNVGIGGLEDKMGQHSSVTVTLNYDDSEAELIGQRGHGFRYMLMLMNNARLLVGFEGVGLCEAAYRKAKAFAEERVTMDKPIAKHEMIADYLDEMDVMIKGMRALNFEAAFNEEMAMRKKTVLKVRTPKVEEERIALEKQVKVLRRKARMATPLVKYLCSEQAVKMSRMTMQIMGGVGYMKEYGAEKLLRDSLILPVYEGTSQIQSLMALKDHLQHAMRNPGKFFQGLAKSKIDALSQTDPLVSHVARLKNTYFSAVQTIMTQIVSDKFGDIKDRPLLEWKSAFLKDWNPKHDFRFGLLHAERFTQIAAYVACAKVLVKQAKQSTNETEKEDRKQLALRFIERVEPKCRGLLAEIESNRTSLVRSLFAKKRT